MCWDYDDPSDLDASFALEPCEHPEQLQLAEMYVIDAAVAKAVAELPEEARPNLGSVHGKTNYTRHSVNGARVEVQLAVKGFNGKCGRIGDDKVPFKRFGWRQHGSVEAFRSGLLWQN